MSRDIKDMVDKYKNDKQIFEFDMMDLMKDISGFKTDEKVEVLMGRFEIW